MSMTFDDFSAVTMDRVEEYICKRDEEGDIYLIKDHLVLALQHIEEYARQLGHGEKSENDQLAAAIYHLMCVANREYASAQRLNDARKLAHKYADMTWEEIMKDVRENGIP